MTAFLVCGRTQTFKFKWWSCVDLTSVRHHQDLHHFFVLFMLINCLFAYTATWYHPQPFFIAF